MTELEEGVSYEPGSTDALEPISDTKTVTTEPCVGAVSKKLSARCGSGPDVRSA